MSDEARTDEVRNFLLKKMTTGAEESVEMVVRFSNEDVPKYLARLQEIESAPSRIRRTTC